MTPCPHNCRDYEWNGMCKHSYPASEVTIPVGWFHSLMDYASRSDFLLGDDHGTRLKYGLSELLGFISSAEKILSLKQPIPFKRKKNRKKA